MFSFLSVAQPAPAIEHGQAAEILNSVVRRLRGSSSCWQDQHREHRRQQHEHQRLHEAHQQFHEIKRNRQQPAQVRAPACDMVSSMFSPAKMLP